MTLDTPMSVYARRLIDDLIIVGICVSSIAAVLFIALPHAQRLPDPSFAWDTTTTTACSSNSMGLSFGCNDTLLLETLSPDDDVYTGRVYIYKDGNHTVVHRLAYCLDENCTRTIFKGDNNVRGELVERTEILYLVKGTMYTGNE